MELIVLDRLEVSLRMDELAGRLRVEDNRGGLADSLDRLAKEVLRIATPKAMYGVVYAEVKEDDEVVLDGITFRSRILAVNVASAPRVFPFLVTCGKELANWAVSKGDLLDRYLADAILDGILNDAAEVMTKHITRRYRLSKTAVMTPGSLADWPIEEQRPLFSLLGDTEKHIGVRLLESLMMTPVQSLSGVLFSTEVDFASCQLCPRESCHKRRAPYDVDLYETHFRKEHT
jgi:hypothetical protein